ncbi:MAG: cation:proton antiporter [Sphingomonadales bacterium]|nr:cation:proton antiporter [Sphingomonadales bacterium]
MTSENALVLSWAVDSTFVLLLLAMVLAFIRLARGPSLPDRVVALDLLTVLAVAFCALFAIASGEPAFLDVAIALALVAFLATVAFARFAERRKVSGLNRSDAPGDST